MESVQFPSMPNKGFKDRNHIHQRPKLCPSVNFTAQPGHRHLLKIVLPRTFCGGYMK